ncbi:hypothetical protein RFI_01361, partial [Reticulomyxa filosa]
TELSTDATMLDVQAQAQEEMETIATLEKEMEKERMKQEEKMNNLKEQRKQQLLLKYFVEWLQNSKSHLKVLANIRSQYQAITEHCLITAPRIISAQMTSNSNPDSNPSPSQNQNEQNEQNQNSNSKLKSNGINWKTNFVCWKPNELFAQECPNDSNRLCTQSKARIHKLFEEQTNLFRPPRLSPDMKKAIFGERLKEFEYEEISDNENDTDTDNNNARKEDKIQSGEKTSKLHWSQVFDEQNINWLLQNILEWLKTNKLTEETKDELLDKSVHGFVTRSFRHPNKHKENADQIWTENRDRERDRNRIRMKERRSNLPLLLLKIKKLSFACLLRTQLDISTQYSQIQLERGISYLGVNIPILHFLPETSRFLFFLTKWSLCFQKKKKTDLNCINTLILNDFFEERRELCLQNKCTLVCLN